MTDDKKLLERAIDIAEKSIYEGGGPFGAVITFNGDIIAQSNNRVVMNADPTAHAEILAIRMAAEKLGNHDLGGCVLYTSCEPCPMCLGAIYWAGIQKIVYALDRNDAASAGFSDEFIYKEISLDPARRKLTFLKLKEPVAKEIFRKWDDFEGRINY